MSEITLIRYFPTGRGLQMAEAMEPSSEDYQRSISSFLATEAQAQNGPRIKLQCALKSFHPDARRSVPCKMGCNSLCVMPDGTLLTCPWAYGMGGQPLDQAFVAGNLAKEPFVDCYNRVFGLSESLRKQYPVGCRVCGFVAAQRLFEVSSKASMDHLLSFSKCREAWGKGFSGHNQTSLMARTVHPQ